jgi:sulfide:quinone oxidoreductase
MADPNGHATPGDKTDALRVLIAGAGVAGLEAAFALQQLAGERVDTTVLAPVDEFVYRPMSVLAPFASGNAQRYQLSPLIADAGATLLRDALVEVDPEARIASTGSGSELSYDALLVAMGTAMHAPFEHATTIDDARMDELLHGLVEDVEEGYLKRLAIVVPGPAPWPLPAYELALMISERAWDMQTELHVTVLTPEGSPLAAFGLQASAEVAQLLTERQIDVVASAYCDVPTAKTVKYYPRDGSLEVDRVVALPALRGPTVSGLPQNGDGFIPVDQYGRVRGVESVWAAGDATDFPVKHGGVSAQLADTAAASIASLAGACAEPEPFDPVIEGVLLTGSSPRRLRGHLTGGHGPSELAKIARDAAPPKVAARYLTPHLTSAEAFR